MAREKAPKLSSITKIIKSHICNSNLKYPEKWEKDLETELDWQEIWRETFKVKSSHFILSNYKMVTRAYFSNDNLKNINTPLMCSWCNSSVASFRHKIWSCHHIVSFWEKIMQICQELFNLGSVTRPLLLLLLPLPLPSDLNSIQKEVLRVMTAAARNLVAKSWQSKDPPGTTAWIQLSISNLQQELYFNLTESSYIEEILRSLTNFR